MPMQATTTTPLFSAALKPDRSPRVAGGWLAFATMSIMGAPLAVVVPEAVIPFAAAFAVGFVALVVMTVRQTRRGRVVQTVTLWPDQLEVLTLDGTGERQLRRFDPRAVRIVLTRDENEKAQELTLRNSGESLALGTFLSAEDRASFARSFGTALRKARQQA